VTPQIANVKNVLLFKLVLFIQIQWRVKNLLWGETRGVREMEVPQWAQKAKPRCGSEAEGKAPESDAVC